MIEKKLRQHWVCDWDTALTCSKDAALILFYWCGSNRLRETLLWSIKRNVTLILFERRDSELLREMWLWSLKRNTIWTIERNAIWPIERSQLCWHIERTRLWFVEKTQLWMLRETRLWIIERNVALSLLETQACVLQLVGGDALFRLVKGRGLQNTVFKALHTF